MVFDRESYLTSCNGTFRYISPARLGTAAALPHNLRE
jgi:hypothetical protein